MLAKFLHHGFEVRYAFGYRGDLGAGGEAG